MDNNIWVIGDDDECVVIDAPHDVDDILAVVGGRTVKAIVCTHAHDDHVRVAPELRERVVAPILLHPADRPVWSSPTPTTCGTSTSRTGDGQGRRCRARRCCTPPATRPGGCASTCTTSAASSPATPCSRAARVPPAARSATRTRSRQSIRAKLFALPDETVVHTGHGDDTTIGAERAPLGG